MADQTAVVASRKAVRDYLRSQLARYTHDESQIPLSQGLKIVCIWYCELEYWTAKLIEAFPPPPSAGDQIVGEDHRGKEKEGAPKDEEDYAAMAIMFPDLVPSLQQRLAEKLLPSSGSSAKEQQKDADYHEHPPPSSSKNNEDEKMLIKAYKEAAEMVETLGILKYKIEKKELFDKPMVVGKI